MNNEQDELGMDGVAMSRCPQDDLSVSSLGGGGGVGKVKCKCRVARRSFKCACPWEKDVPAKDVKSPSRLWVCRRGDGEALQLEFGMRSLIR